LGIVTETLPSVSLKFLASGWAGIEQMIGSYEFPFHLDEIGGGLRTGVQTPVVGQEDSPHIVCDVMGFLVHSPFDLFGLPNLPDGARGWGKDLGDPHVPGGDVYRGSEDRRSGEEQNSESGRELHRENGLGFVRSVEGGGRWLKKLKNREDLVVGA